jgi:hypothetical protein
MLGIQDYFAILLPLNASSAGRGGVREFGPFLVSYRAIIVRYYTISRERLNGKKMHQCVKVWFETGKGRAAPKDIYENAQYDTIYNTIMDAARIQKIV